jgi:Fur family transcriptional regulator, ferric uptake regulator
MLIDTHILEMLHEQGFRNTGPRRAIVEAALGRHGRFTAAEMVDALQGHGVGRATVFRTLDLLTSLGVLERIHSDDRCHTYTLCVEAHHHHHLICTSCAAVTEVTSPSVEQAVHRMAEEAGFQLERHIVEILGLCQACQDARDGGKAGRGVTALTPALSQRERG